MSSTPAAVSAAQDHFDKRVRHTMADELADLAWSIHEGLGGIELGKTAKSREVDHAILKTARDRLAELATMLAEQAAELDPLSA